MLQHCDKQLWHDDVVAQVFGCLTRLPTLYKSSIWSVLHQRGYFQKGRIEYFAIVYSEEYTVSDCGLRMRFNGQ